MINYEVYKIYLAYTVCNAKLNYLNTEYNFKNLNKNLTHNKMHLYFINEENSNFRIDDNLEFKETAGMKSKFKQVTILNKFIPSLSLSITSGLH